MRKQFHITDNKLKSRPTKTSFKTIATTALAAAAITAGGLVWYQKTSAKKSAPDIITDSKDGNQKNKQTVVKKTLQELEQELKSQEEIKILNQKHLAEWEDFQKKEKQKQTEKKEAPKQSNVTLSRPDPKLTRKEILTKAEEARRSEARRISESAKNQKPNTIINQASRHTVSNPESDATVQYLKKLEDQYRGNPTELAKVMTIKVHTNSIEIAGYRLKRQNESTPENKSAGIFRTKEGHTLFTFDAAIAKYWKNRIPSDDAWTKICEAIPWKSDKKHQANMQHILDISYAGYRNTGGDFDNAGREASLWSSSENVSFNAHYVYLSRDDVEAERDWNNREYAFSVRLLQDN